MSKTTTALLERAERADQLIALAAASANVNTTQILLDELQKVGDPLPIPLAKLGLSGLGNRVLLLLQEQGNKDYTEAEYRRALQQVIRELTDTSRDPLTRAQRMRADAQGAQILDAHAEIVLAEQGKTVESATAEEYLDAVALAKRRTGIEYASRQKTVRATPSGTKLEDGPALHLCAEVILRKNGATTNARGELVYSAAEYAEALHEAQETLTAAV